MLKPDVEEGSIARLCGSLKGTVHKGVDKIFAAKPDYSLSTVDAVDSSSTEDLEPEFRDPREINDMEEQVYSVVRHMVQDVQGNDVLMRHLLAGILRVKGASQG